MEMLLAVLLGLYVLFVPGIALVVALVKGGGSSGYSERTLRILEERVHRLEGELTRLRREASPATTVRQDSVNAAKPLEDALPALAETAAPQRPLHFNPALEPRPVPEEGFSAPRGVLDAPLLGRADAVVRNGGHVANRGHRKADGLKRAQG